MAHMLNVNAPQELKEKYLRIRVLHSANKTIEQIAKAVELDEDEVREYLDFCGYTVPPKKKMECPFALPKKKRGRPRKS
ncbi:MAG: hypothetical protein ACI4KH_05885 [Oscillospiraceae bacterium]